MASSAESSPSQLSIETIDPHRFRSLLQDYDGLINGKLVDLDRERYEVIPKHLKERNTDDGQSNLHLVKEDLVKLMEWKL